MAFNHVSPASDPLDATAGLGTKDGRGCGDHDQPYTFGRRPRGVAPFPFTLRQYTRLLALRGLIGDGLLGSDDLDAAGFAAELGQAETAELGQAETAELGQAETAELGQPETPPAAEKTPLVRKTPKNAR